MATKKVVPIKLAKLAKPGTAKALAPPKTRGWVTKPKPFTSVSFSRWGDWDKCPRYAHWKHILKKPEGPKNDAMLRGIFIAEQEEAYFTGKAQGIPPDIHKAHHKLFKFAKSQKTLMVEQNWGFNRQWEPVDYFDWNNCFLRIKVDFGWQDVKKNVIHLKDNKTGKFREQDNDKYVMQLELYTAGGAGMFPSAKGFTSELVYTDLGISYPPTEPMSYTMSEAKKLQKDWDKRFGRMVADETFRPKPGFYCSWCPYTKSKGGDCEY